MTTAPTLTEHLWWLASRASGLVALGLITASVVLGLMMSGRIMRKPGRAKSMVALHEQFALAGMFAIVLHGVTLLGDAFLNPGITGITIPGAIDYRPLWTGFGIGAGYLAALLGLTFYVRKSIGPRLWRRAHRLTIVVYAMAVVHTLGAGTDASTPWLRWWLYLTAPTIVVLFAIRVTEPWRRKWRQRTATRPGGAQPAGAQPQLGQPQLGQPQLGQPQVVQAQVAQPKFSQPQVVQARVFQAQVVHAHVNRPRSQNHVNRPHKQTHVNRPHISNQPGTEMGT